MATTKKSAASAAKKTTAKKAAADSKGKRTAGKAVAAESATDGSAAMKSRTKKSPAKKRTVKKAAAKRTAKNPPAKAAAMKSTKKRAAAKKTSAAKQTAKKRTAKKTPAKKSPFGKRFNDEMKKRLLAERARYLHSEEIYRAEAEALIEGREPGDVQFDEESGEGDTLAVERERDLALSAQARVAVEQIDAALERIAAGTYGICVVSGLRIPQERLRAIPWAAERVEYKVGSLGRR